jgi:hypothetical protein
MRWLFACCCVQLLVPDRDALAHFSATYLFIYGVYFQIPANGVLFVRAHKNMLIGFSYKSVNNIEREETVLRLVYAFAL